MAVSLTYPGVYVQEVPSGVRTIAGVSTSTTLFVGAAGDGPINRPTLCLSYTDRFRDIFGENGTAGDLARYVKLFFLNGGTRCYVSRIANGAQTSTVAVVGGGRTFTPVLALSAKSAGLSGETIRAAVNYKGQLPEVAFSIDVFRAERRWQRHGARELDGAEHGPGVRVLCTGVPHAE